MRFGFSLVICVGFFGIRTMLTLQNGKYIFLEAFLGCLFISHFNEPDFVLLKISACNFLLLRQLSKYW